MRHNETPVIYPGPSEYGEFHIRFFEAEVSFSHRDFFEHKHSDFEISYILSGSGIYSMDSGKCRFDEGDVFVFGTNRIHCITELITDSPAILVTIQFEPRIIWSPFSGLLGEDCRSLFNGKCEKLPSGEVSEFIASRLLDIRREATEKRAGWQIMLRAYLCEIIGALVRDSGASLSAPNSDIKRESLICMDKAMTYINSRLGEKLTLDEIARKAGFSRTYFSPLFTSLNGLSPWEYITIRRIEKSKELLRTTELSVIAVATQCGFSNISNFNRMFARITGVNPTTYRKSTKT